MYVVNWAGNMHDIGCMQWQFYGKRYLILGPQPAMLRPWPVLSLEWKSEGMMDGESGEQKGGLR